MTHAPLLTLLLLATGFLGMLISEYLRTESSLYQRQQGRAPRVGVLPVPLITMACSLCGALSFGAGVAMALTLAMGY